MYNETAYNKAIEILNRDTGQLLQKFNFFLLATGFLVVAFATTLTVGTGPKLYVEYFLTSTGLAFSLIYAVIMNHNTRILFQIGKYIRELEVLDFADHLPSDKEKPYVKIDNIVNNAMAHKTTFPLLRNLLGDFLDLVFRPKEVAKRTVADHFYVVPIFFAVIWMCLLILFVRGILTF